MIKLKHISRKKGFRVPKQYFEDFKLTLYNTKGTKNKAVFSVPDAYFDNLNINVPKPSKTIKLNEFQKTIAVAAVLILLLGTLLTGLLIDSKPNIKELNFSKINKTEIIDYIEDEMLIEHDLYLEDQDMDLKLDTKPIKQNTVIDDMDDISIEQLLEY